jgi:cell division protease FtsH
MITRYGMSDKLGPRTFGKREELVFLGREISEQRDYSDKVAETIDDEVHSLIDTAYDRAKALLVEHNDKLVALAKYLMEHETADAPDLEEILGKLPGAEKEPPRPFIGSPAPAAE